jgi:hypothetical protein
VETQVTGTANKQILWFQNKPKKTTHMISQSVNQAIFISQTKEAMASNKFRAWSVNQSQIVHAVYSHNIA